MQTRWTAAQTREKKKDYLNVISIGNFNINKIKTISVFIFIFLVGINFQFYEKNSMKITMLTILFKL
jgi:hypothetical protein